MVANEKKMLIAPALTWKPIAYVIGTGAVALGIGEVTLGQGVLVALVGMLSAVIVALLSRQPLVRRARLDEQQIARSNRLEEDRLQSAEAAGVIENLNAVHAAQMAGVQAMHAQQVAYLHQQIGDAKKECTATKRDAANMRLARELVRISKHKTQGEVQRAYLYISEAQRQLQAANVMPPPFVFKNYEDMCGEEDRKMLEIFQGGLD